MFLVRHSVQCDSLPNWILYSECHKQLFISFYTLPYARIHGSLERNLSELISSWWQIVVFIPYECRVSSSVASFWVLYVKFQKNDKRMYFQALFSPHEKEITFWGHCLIMRPADSIFLQALSFLYIFAQPLTFFNISIIDFFWWSCSLIPLSTLWWLYVPAMVSLCVQNAGILSRFQNVRNSLKRLHISHSFSFSSYRTHEKSKQ